MDVIFIITLKLFLKNQIHWYFVVTVYIGYEFIQIHWFGHTKINHLKLYIKASKSNKSNSNIDIMLTL